MGGDPFRPSLTGRHFFYLFLFALAAFSPVLFRGGYVYDDVVVIAQNGLLRSFSGLAQIWKGHVDPEHVMDGTFRPLLLSIFSLIGRLSDFSPVAFRVSTLLLHVANAWLLAVLAQRIFRLSVISALGAATLFLLHPIQTTSFGLVWKQSDLWIALAALVSIRVYLTHPLLALFPFLLAFGFKESAMGIPLLWLSIEPLLSSEKRRSRLAVMGVGILASATYYLSVLPQLPKEPDESGVPLARVEYFLTELPVLGLYLKAILNPYLLTIDRRVIAVSPAPVWGFGLILMMGAGWILAHAAAFRRASKELAAFLLGLAWLIPTSTLQPLSLLYDETRCYLGMGALGILLACLAERIPRRVRPSPRVAWFCLFAFAFLLSSFTLFESTRWSSESALWSATLEVDPHSPRAHYHLGLAAQKARAPRLAEEHYREALAYSPGWHAARLGLGITLGQEGKLDEAEDVFQDMTSLPPAWAALGHYHLGLGRMYRHDFQGAAEQFRRANDMDPRTLPGAKGMAILLARRGRRAEALEAWDRYIHAPQRSREERADLPREIRRLFAVQNKR
ncbi:MAG: tetratricopeptide repeat protein [Pseudomonadota bacterium]